MLTEYNYWATVTQSFPGAYVDYLTFWVCAFMEV